LYRAQYRHTLYFITSRVETLGGSIEEQTTRWLDERKGVVYPAVIVVNSWTEKASLYRSLRLDSYIDDKPDTVRDMLTKGENCWVLDQPWNAAYNLPDRVKTVQEYILSVEERFGGGS
jgi:hypothetical protein